MAFIFDEIGHWTEMKLDIIEKYAKPYSVILSNTNNPALHHIYIDAFAGSGTHVSRGTRGLVLGSPRRALNIQPPFKEYYFIDTDEKKIAELNKEAAKYPQANIHVLLGDCNSILLTQVFPKVLFKDYRRGLCLFDPYGLDLKWQVVETAGQMGTIDMILNFPVMDMNRNVFWKDPSGVDELDVARMGTFWGDDSWKTEAYRHQTDLFGEGCEIKETNITIALAFKERLEKVARFKYVSKPVSMQNT